MTADAGAPAPALYDYDFEKIDSVGMGVPEPATWAPMIGGFGLTGAASAAAAAPSSATTVKAIKFLRISNPQKQTGNLLRGGPAPASPLQGVCWFSAPRRG